MRRFRYVDDFGVGSFKGEIPMESFSLLALNDAMSGITLGTLLKFLDELYISINMYPFSQKNIIRLRKVFFASGMRYFPDEKTFLYNGYELPQAFQDYIQKIGAVIFGGDNTKRDFYIFKNCSWKEEEIELLQILIFLTNFFEGNVLKKELKKIFSKNKKTITKNLYLQITYNYGIEVGSIYGTSGKFNKEKCIKILEGINFLKTDKDFKKLKILGNMYLRMQREIKGMRKFDFN